MKKILSVLLAAVLLLCLCACNENTASKPEEQPLQPPDTIYGAWYPMPDVSEMPVEVFDNGTCKVNGETWNWVTKSVAEEKVVLIAGEGEEQFEIEFLYLTTSVPVLAQKQVGWAIREPELWQYMTEWINEETGNTFTLSFFAMLSADCKLYPDNGTLKVEVTENDQVTYTLELTPGQCQVTDAEGSSTVYTPVDQ